MDKNQWGLVKEYFSPEEPWGDPEKVQWYHVHHLFLLRKRLVAMGCNWPMVIHCSYEKAGHASKSYHSRNGESIATDFHFGTDEPFSKQYLIMEQALADLALKGFVGLGVYPDWNNPGFHLDGRGEKVRWGRLGDDYIYDMNVVLAYIL